METICRRFRAAVLLGAAASVLAFAAGAKAQNLNSNGNQWQNGNHWPYGNPTPDNTWPYATIGRSPVLAVVGDISCQPGEKESSEKANQTCADSLSKVVTTLVEPLVPAQVATAQQIENMKPDLVALLGDLQYQVGQYSDFKQSFDLTYGAFKFLQRPAPGNHEFYDEHSAIGVLGYGYFSYFNGVQTCQPINTTTCIAPVGSPVGVEMTTITDPIFSTSFEGSSTTDSSGGTFISPVPLPDGQAGHFEETGGFGSGTAGPVGVGDGWYSYNLGSWHIISLNVECGNQPGNCDLNGSWWQAEHEWLKNDLEANHSACTLAYWHQPTFSAADSLTIEGANAKDFWQLLYDAGADLVLNGHDHLYARYKPLDPNGNYDERKGIREFIVGTGGETLDLLATTGTASDPSGNNSFNTNNIEKATADYWGVMALTLDANGYKWDFESALKDPAQTSAPATYSGDKGEGACHGRPGWPDNNQGR